MNKSKPSVDTIVVVFPYNQHSLFVPNHEDWPIFTNLMGEKSLLVVSPNSLKIAKPNTQNIAVMHHEMILNFWREIKNYVSGFKIKRIIIITSDIDRERVTRDYSIVFSGQGMDTRYFIIETRNSFWKIIYRIREKIILMLPIKLYERLGKNR